VRRDAIGRLDDPETLGRLARSAKRESVRVAAIEKSNSVELLAELCRDPGWVIRKAAVARIPDETVVVSLALDDPDP
jgi:hypothetical protein